MVQTLSGLKRRHMIHLLKNIVIFLVYVISVTVARSRAHHQILALKRCVPALYETNMVIRQTCGFSVVGVQKHVGRITMEDLETRLDWRCCGGSVRGEIRMGFM